VSSEEEAEWAPEAKPLWKTDAFLIPDKNGTTIPLFPKFILVLDSQEARSVAVTTLLGLEL
jgi:hypothetical protein